jgi:hypothetical protein
MFASEAGAMNILESLQPYAPPARQHNAKGELRRVGLELEIGHLPLESVLELVQRSMGGRVEQASPAQGKVADTPLGSFAVELDSRALKERAYLRPLAMVGLEPESSVSQLIESSVVRVSRELVPIEVVTPPIPWDRLHELDPLWTSLRDAGAEDTHASVLYAFGLHLNPEVPDFEARTIAGYLQAFLLLEPWLVAATEVDLSRRIAPYIRPFPAEYRQLILAPDYEPDLETLIAHYLEHNPTRNRPLDLMPLFVHATHADYSARMEDWALVKPRPTFHYRLPNSEIQRPNWSPAVDWNRWIAVERLASTPELLPAMLVDWTQMAEGSEAPPNQAWLAHLQMRLDLPAVADSLLES